MKHQNIISAIEAGDLRRARKLLDDALAPKGSRAFDDIVGAVESVFTRAGERCPALHIRHKTDVQRAAIGVDTFLTHFGIAVKSSNRNLAVALVCRHIIEFVKIPPAGTSDIEAKEHFKIPPYLRALRVLSDVRKMVAAVGIHFPGYLDSGLVVMLGFDGVDGAVKSSPVNTNLSVKELHAIVSGVDIK